MNDHVTIRQWISRRRLRASVDRTLGVKVPKAVFDEAEAYARRKMAFQNEALGLDRGELDGVDGYAAVLFWQGYRSSNDPRWLETLLSYNAADVLALPVLLAHAINELLDATPFAERYALPIPAPGHNPHAPDPNVLHRLAWAFSRK